jgi:hypothetical protein
MYSNLIISATATQDGYGSGRHRVLGLSADEQKRAVAGERVFYRATRTSKKGPHGSFWRVVKVDSRQMYPRVPTLQEIELLRITTGVA